MLREVADEEQLRPTRQRPGAKCLEIAAQGMIDTIVLFRGQRLQEAAFSGRIAQDHLGPLEDAAMDGRDVVCLGRQHRDRAERLIVRGVAEDLLLEFVEHHLVCGRVGPAVNIDGVPAVLAKELGQCHVDGITVFQGDTAGTDMDGRLVFAQKWTIRSRFRRSKSSIANSNCTRSVIRVVCSKMFRPTPGYIRFVDGVTQSTRIRGGSPCRPPRNPFRAAW